MVQMQRTELLGTPYRSGPHLFPFFLLLLFLLEILAEEPVALQRAEILVQ